MKTPSAMRLPLLPALVATCLLNLASPAPAQHMNANESPCANSGSTVDTVACLARAGKQSDADLNATYRRIRQVLNPAERGQLQKAERLWIAYREAICTAERGLYAGGTGATPAYLGCVDAETRHHTVDLKVTYGFRLQKFG